MANINIPGVDELKNLNPEALHNRLFALEARFSAIPGSLDSTRFSSPLFPDIATVQAHQTIGSLFDSLFTRLKTGSLSAEDLITMAHVEKYVAIMSNRVAERTKGVIADTSGKVEEAATTILTEEDGLVPESTGEKHVN